MPRPRRLAARFAAVTPGTRGALYMVIAAFFFALMNSCVRLASDAGLHPTEVAFFRNAFALCFMLPWLLRTGFAGARTRRIGQHFWRALVGLTGMFLWFAAIAVMPLAEAVALNFTFPLFATILAALVLKEDVRARRWTATLVGFLGVLVVLQPWGAEVRLVSLLPVVAALFMAGSSVLVKQLSRTEAPGTMVLYMNLIMTPIALVPALFFWTWPTLETWGVLFVLGFFAAVSHIALVRAYAIADASALQPYDYLRLPFIAAIGYLWFHEVPDGWLWAGAAIIAGSTFYIARREAQVARERTVTRAARPPDAVP